MKKQASLFAVFLRREPVLCASFLLAATAALLVRPKAALYVQAIDFRTIAILFSLMLVTNDVALLTLTVFHVLPFWAMLLFTIAVIGICDFRLFKKADYSLLLTFAFFFIFTKTISTLPEFSAFVQKALSSRLSTYIAGIAASQVISNVHALERSFPRPAGPLGLS